MSAVKVLCLLFLTALPVLSGAGPAGRPVKVVLFPIREAEIVSRIDGTVKLCALKMGDSFKKGDLIMQIDDSRHLIELARAKARQTDVKIQAKFAQETYLSYKKLFEENIQSHNELARRKAEADSLHARERISAADLSEALLMLGYCDFRAPFAGRLEQMLCREHETVRVGQPVFKIIDDSALLAVMNIPQELPVRVGSEVKMSFRNGSVTVMGKVREISPRADHRSGTIEVKVLVNNSKGTLTSGMVGAMTSFNEGE